MVVGRAQVAGPPSAPLLLAVAALTNRLN